MGKSKIVSINVEGLLWFDSVNGNTYHAANIFVDYNNGEQIEVNSAMVYGYGEGYIQTAVILLEGLKIIPSATACLWRFCRDNGIFYHTYKKNVLKRDINRKYPDQIQGIEYRQIKRNIK